MKKDSHYLSEQELEQLILHIEQNELIAAPPDLAERIVGAVVEDSGVEERKDGLLPGMAASARGKREFRRYCFRVLGGVAAAVAVIFLLPYADAGKLTKDSILQERVTGSGTFSRPETPTRQEMLQTGRYATKEEALQDSGLLVQWLGGGHIFNRDDKWNIFAERDGG